MPADALLEADACHDCTKGVKRLSLRRSIAWSFLGYCAYAGCQWGFLVILTKLGSATMLGQYVLALATATPIMLLAQMGLQTVVATDAKHQHPFGEVVALFLTAALVGMVVVIGIALLAPACRPISGIIVLMGIYRALDMLGDLTNSLLQRHARMDRIAILQLAKGTSGLAVMGSVLLATGSLLLALAFLCVVRTLWLLFGDFSAAAWVVGSRAAVLPHWHFKALAGLATLAAPMGIGYFLANLQLNIPRYFIVGNLGEHALGIFAGIAYLTTAGVVVNGAVTFSTLPRLAEYYATSRTTYFITLLFKTLSISGLLGIIAFAVIALAGRPLLSLVYTPEYAEYSHVLYYLGGAFCLQLLGATLSNAVRSMRYFRTLFVLTAASVAILATLCAFLVPRFGLLGASWAVLLNAAGDALAYGSVILFRLRTSDDLPVTHTGSD